MRISYIPLVAAALLFSHQAWSQDYAIKLHRPMKAGDKHRVEGTGASKQSTLVTAGGKAVTDEKADFTSVYDAEETVVEVSADGRPTKISVKIAKLTMTQGGETKELLPKDTVLIATKPDKKDVFEVNGAAVSPDAAKALGLYISVGQKGPTDDEIFGTKDRKKVGDTWDANAKLAAADFEADSGGKVENIAGKTKLVAVEKGAAGEVEKISATITGKFLPPLPPTIVVSDATMEAVFEGDFPVNPDLQRTKDSIKMQMKFAAQGDTPQGKLDIKGAVEQSRSSKITPIK